ncbi:helix-turn-helix domain-containing protein [Chryseolinea soli]|uniref:Helix-turn-helix domain-containing protein n=1 Tax=Chryseolinea soli TaxID=2321403 RepID=A0A385SP24_9BACT|nr:helix-turn-helix domain-containing protein [Chryseolinea soli]AYB32027.1 helix-turn-helix domain-containing protein [Chryseolinea soli]
MAKRELEPDLGYQKAFGNRVRELREKVGWTQVDLSIYSKVSDYQISVIENGHEAANLQTIKAIAAALGKLPSELLDFKYPIKLNNSFPKKPKEKLGTTGHIQKLFSEGYFVDPKSVKNVIEYVFEVTGTKLVSKDTSGALLVFAKNKLLRIIRREGRNLYQSIKKAKS